MATTFTQPVSSQTTLTVTGFSTLANGTYVASNDIDLTTLNSVNGPLDLQILVEATPGSVSGNKQVVVFAQASKDGSTYTTGPTSGTTTTDEPVLHYVGALPLPTNSTLQRRWFSLAATFPTLPPHCRLIFKNDSGAALTTAVVTIATVTASGA